MGEERIVREKRQLTDTGLRQGSRAVHHPGVEGVRRSSVYMQHG